jgi:hypothetical protein
MNKKISGYGQLALVGLMCLGGWLALGSGARFLTGFILVISSFAGFAFLVRRTTGRPLAQGESEVWSRVKAGGKSNYIRKAVVKGFLLGVISSSLALLKTLKETGFTVRNLVLFIALVSIATFLGYYLAVRAWDANEKRNKRP